MALVFQAEESFKGVLLANMNEKTLEEIFLIKIASFSSLVEVNKEMQMGCIKLIK